SATVEAAETIDSAAQELLRFVNDILEIARAESGRIELNPSDMRLAPVLDALEPWIRSLTLEHDLTYSIRMPSRIPLVHADETRLRQVLTNLVDNAVKYTPRGGHVEIRVRADRASVAVSVQDTGVGIPTDDTDRL